MVRKGTIILLVIFVLLAGLAFYLDRNPLPTGQTTTPIPTEPALLLEGWQTADLTAVERQFPSGEALRVQKNEEGIWTFGTDGVVVETGLVEQLRSEITSLRPTTVLDPGIDLEAIGMTAPQSTIHLENAQGGAATLRIGALTPTGSGYYVQVDNSAPVVVDTFAIDAILELLDRSRLNPPATEPDPTPTTG